MKTIGILGGLGPESTVDYYKGIITGYREIKGKEHFPQIYINSINITEMIGYVAQKDFNKLIDLLVFNLNKLENIGADILAISSNTPHVVIDAIKEKVNTPILNIVEETRKIAQSQNLKKVLLTGTSFTMNSSFFQNEFNKYNIECIVPNNDEKEIIQNIIFPDLENGIIKDDDKKAFLEICNNKIEMENIDGIILGCTELPLLVKEDDFRIFVLNTTKIHINSIVNAII